MPTVFHTALATLALVFATSAASAVTQTVTFDGGSCSEWNQREGVFSFGRNNWGNYGVCAGDLLIGDDGWENDDFVAVDPGYVFDILGFDLYARYELARLRGDFTNSSDATDAFLAGEYDPVEAYDFITISGFRDEVLSARVSFDPRVTTAPDVAGFTGLDRVEFHVDAFGAGAGAEGFLFPDGAWYSCPNGGQCGIAVFDNLRVDVRSTGADVAPVPLPAGGLLLLGALGGLTALRRRRG